MTIVELKLEDGSLGKQFPSFCPDGMGPCGADTSAFSRTLQAEIPELDWPLRKDESPASNPWAVLDFLQFCFRAIGKPIEHDYHPFFGHNHLSFDEQHGREEFRDQINRIFSRNGVSFRIEDDGRISRLVPSELGTIIPRKSLATGDNELDNLLSEARTRYLTPSSTNLQDSLEKLWDAWERTKTLDDPSNKKRSVLRLLDKVASEPSFRGAIEDEANELTKIGNTFRIRHSETSQAALEETEHLDYLFHRMLAFLRMVLQLNLRWQGEEIP